MREQGPTDWLNKFINQKRLDDVVTWHNREWKINNIPEFKDVPHGT